MNGARYNELVVSKFAVWRRRCFRDNKTTYLVQDGERCLWQERNLKALRAAGLVVEEFPKCSPDLNVIEGVWARLRALLAEREPEKRETRSNFVKRLRRTVNWMNANKKTNMRKLCRNLKERARDVIALGGAKSKW